MKKIIRLPVTSEWGQIGKQFITNDDIDDLGKSFYKYIQETSIPIIKEFTSSNGISFDEFMRVPALQNLILLCRNKKESGVERGGLNNTISQSMVKLELIQEGWTTKDKDIVHDEIAGDIDSLLKEIAVLTNGKIIQGGGASIEQDE